MGCCTASKPKQETDQRHPTRRMSSKAMSPGAFVKVSNQPFLTQYEPLKELGEGAFGEVMLVRHRSTGLERACKKIVITEDANQEQIMEELEIMKEIDHPNIIKVYECFEEEHVIHIVLELCTGGELFDRITERKKLTENEAARYMLNLISAMNYLHSINIVHRDLKPENLLLENESAGASIKLADFGTATHFDRAHKLDLNVGTPYYIAPEVIDSEYDEKCDVWSAGVIMFVLLCGCPPFNGKNENEIYQKVKQAKVEFKQPVWKSISSDATHMIKKMLTKDPRKRPSFSEVLNEKWVQERGRNMVPDRPIAVDSLTKLSGFTVQSKLQRATLSFISAQLLNQEEIQDLKKLFEAIDVNKDGRLSRQELEQGFAKYGLTSQFNPDKMMELCDTDQNGYVDYNEFLTATLDWQKSLSHEKLYEAFKMYDTNNDGKISLEEIRRVFLDEEDEEQDEHFFMNIIQEADNDGDGEIDFDEFTAFMMQKMGRN